MSSMKSVLIEVHNRCVRHPDNDAWILRVVQAASDKGVQAPNLAVVLDDAPAQRGLETRIGSEIAEVKLMRLGPYSALLNPIELLWCQIKSRIEGATSSKCHLERLKNLIDIS